METPIPTPLTRSQARRLREVYRSAGWPYQDTLEVELLTAGLLCRVQTPGGHELVRVTDAGLACIASSLQVNRQAFSAHEALVNQVAQTMLRDGRLVWTGLEVRARLPGGPDTPNRWKICRPDVFSIRNSSRENYLEPIVHEIKVSRADLLGDLKLPDKREAYLDVGGQCWYVLGCNSRGKVIAQADEVPVTCGVMQWVDGRLEVVRAAPRRAVKDLPFGVWMALAKATPVQALGLLGEGGDGQLVLGNASDETPDGEVTG